LNAPPCGLFGTDFRSHILCACGKHCVLSINPGSCLCTLLYNLRAVFLWDMREIWVAVIRLNQRVFNRRS
jgi:hypothetical protein